MTAARNENTPTMEEAEREAQKLEQLMRKRGVEVQHNVMIRARVEQSTKEPRVQTDVRTNENKISSKEKDGGIANFKFSLETLEIAVKAEQEAKEYDNHNVRA